MPIAVNCQPYMDMAQAVVRTIEQESISRHFGDVGQLLRTVKLAVEHIADRLPQDIPLREARKSHKVILEVEQKLLESRKLLESLDQKKLLEQIDHILPIVGSIEATLDVFANSRMAAALRKHQTDRASGKPIPTTVWHPDPTL